MTALVLTPAQRAELHALLLELGARLRGEVSDALHSGGETASLSNQAGDADRAVADLENDIEVAGLARDTHELAEVAAALERIAQPSFGFCADCGKRIAWQRLRALPYARRCIDCEAAAEVPAPGAGRI